MRSFKGRILLSQKVDTDPHGIERRDLLAQEWSELLASLGWFPLLAPNRGLSAAEIIDFLKIDGIILTGGNDLLALSQGPHSSPSRDRLEKELLELSTLRKLPLFGVCRGFQHLLIHHEGKAERVQEHVDRRHSIEVSPKRLSLPRSLEVNSFHNWGFQASNIPSCFQIEARSPEGFVEAASHRDLPQAGVMWHPERDPFLASDRLLIDHFFTEMIP